MDYFNAQKRPGNPWIIEVAAGLQVSKGIHPCFIARLHLNSLCRNAASQRTLVDVNSSFPIFNNKSNKKWGDATKLGTAWVSRAGAITIPECVGAKQVFSSQSKHNSVSGCAVVFRRLRWIIELALQAATSPPRRPPSPATGGGGYNDLQVPNEWWENLFSCVCECLPRTPSTGLVLFRLCLYGLHFVVSSWRLLLVLLLYNCEVQVFAFSIFICHCAIKCIINEWSQTVFHFYWAASHRHLRV